MAKTKTEVRLCIENYAGKVTRYKKRDMAAAVKDSTMYEAIISVDEFKDKTVKHYHRAVWIESREVMKWGKVEGTETRR